jgi:hypothetical protein
MIRPNPSEWTVVVVGNWNPAIFSPNWVAQHLLNVTVIETQLSAGPQVSGLKYQSPTLVVIPHSERLIIGVRNVTDAALIEMETATQTALRLLSHTPVQGVGINFGFLETDPTAELIQTFDLRDSGTLAENQLPVRRTTIIREIDLPPAVLKLNITSAEAQVGFRFNYSYSITSAIHAADLLSGKVLECRNKTNDILSTVFELEFQAEEVNQP